MSLFLLVCQQKPTKEAFLVTSNNDTLTASNAARLDPGDQNDSVHFINVLVRQSLVRHINSTLPDSLDTLFSSQLSLESGTEWTPEAAGLLLDAGLVINTQFAEKVSCTAMVTFAESLFYILVSKEKLTFPAVTCGNITPRSREWASHFFSELFNINKQVATALAVFINNISARRPETQSAEDIVKGLVFDKQALPQSSSPVLIERKKPTTTKIDATPHEDIRLYRSQQSILDTISRHIPEIQALYNKHLKNNSMLGGRLFVTFNVASDGSVIDVSIAKTDIDAKVFLDPFLIYIKTIRFQPIPEKIGTMTFEFPFEFDKDI